MCKTHPMPTLVKFAGHVRSSYPTRFGSHVLDTYEFGGNHERRGTVAVSHMAVRDED